MATDTISIEVDSETARAFAQRTPEERRKLQLLLRLRLQELIAGPVRPLRQIMDEMGQEAEARGLTPEVLESLVHGDYCLENDPRFLQRIASARASLKAGLGIRLEDVG